MVLITFAAELVARDIQSLRIEREQLARRFHLTGSDADDIGQAALELFLSRFNDRPRLARIILGMPEGRRLILIHRVLRQAARRLCGARSPEQAPTVRLDTVPAVGGVPSLEVEDARLLISKVRERLDVKGRLALSVILRGDATGIDSLWGISSDTAAEWFTDGAREVAGEAERVMKAEYACDALAEFVRLVRIYRQFAGE